MAYADIQSVLDIAVWQLTPQLVKQFYKQAMTAQRKIKTIVSALKDRAAAGYGYVYYNPDKDSVWIVLGDSDDAATHNRWCNAMRSAGFRNVRSEAESGPPEKEDWVLIKKADDNLLHNAGTAWRGAQMPFGGPSPLAAMIVGGLLTGGLGYGAGTALEHLFPEKYLERGRLRKTLGVAGLGLGAAAIGLPKWYANAASRSAAGQPAPWKALVAPDSSTPIAPDFHPLLDPNNPDSLASRAVVPAQPLLKHSAALDQLDAALAGIPMPSNLYCRSAAGFAKEAYSDTGFDFDPIVVDQFNKAVWADVRKGFDDPYTEHTSPGYGAAATGLMSGIQSMHNDSPILSPKHVVNGLISAGVNLATAKVVGGVLGALAGITPAAQNTIQNMGLWSGFVGGVVKSIFGS